MFLKTKYFQKHENYIIEKKKSKEKIFFYELAETREKAFLCVNEYLKNSYYSIKLKV